MHRYWVRGVLGWGVMLAMLGILRAKPWQASVPSARPTLQVGYLPVT